VNIGDRQLGRLRAASIIDCAADQDAILASLRSILEGRFHFDAASEPPYGRGGASQRITDILQTIDLKRAFPKRFWDLTAAEPE
jgi:UDP-N-acetylglucosamine 2-epimerase